MLRAIVQDGMVVWVDGPGRERTMPGEYLPIPDQEIDHLFGINLEGDRTFAPFAYPGALAVYDDPHGMSIDRDTGASITKAVHPLCGADEQIGILRDQLVQILNALGMEATPDFGRLNEIAVQEILAARAKKEAL